MGITKLDFKIMADIKIGTADNATDAVGGLKVNGTTVIDSSGNIDAPVTTTNGTFAGTVTVTSNSANALTVGRQGATSPQLKVDASTASVATGLEIVGAASGSGVTARAIGGTNEALTVSGKGTGAVLLGQATSTDVRLVADQPIADSSGNELIKFTKAASAVNEFTIANAATNNLLSITATGGDSNIGFVLAGKGSGGILMRSSVSVKQSAPAAKTTSSTLATTDLLAGIITVNQAGGATSAQQLPLASDLDTTLNSFAADDAFDFSVINTSTVDAEDASITTNTGWTLVGNLDIHAYSAAGSLNSSARFRARKTGTAAWTLYRIS